MTESPIRRNSREDRLSLAPGVRAERIVMGKACSGNNCHLCDGRDMRTLVCTRVDQEAETGQARTPGCKAQQHGEADIENPPSKSSLKQCHQTRIESSDP